MNSSLFVLPSSLTNMTEKQQKIAAAAFAKKWEGRGYEKGESQTFWIELLTEVFGIESPSQFIHFEQQAQLDIPPSLMV